MLGDSVPYTDLLIRIASQSVEAVINSDSVFTAAALNLDEEQLLAAEADNQAYGEILMKALFPEQIQRAYDTAVATAKESTDGHLRVRLQIDDDCARLQAWRWERISQRFAGFTAPLSTSTRTPFSRFTPLPQASAEPLAVTRIKMAFCISNPDKLPDGFVAVRVEDEVRTLAKTIGAVRETYPQIEATILPGHTKLPPDLLDLLKNGGYLVDERPLTHDVLIEQLLGAHVVHFLGHGVFRPDAVSGGGTAALYLENDNGELAITRDDDLIPHLTGAAQVARLVVLMACESARRAGVQPFVGLAGKLVKAGVPAILAMQTKLPMDDEAELTKRFYAALLATGIVDYAANEARSYLYDSHQSDFSIPALFMRLQNGQLLAPDPALAALKGMAVRAAQTVKGPPLPIDVVRTTGKPSQGELELLALTGDPPVDVLNATRDVFLAGDEPKPGFVVLLGSRGTAKTSQLRYAAKITAEKSIASGQRIIPVYVNLADFCRRRATLEDPMIEFLAGSITPYWPDFTPAQFAEMLAAKTGPRFQFLFDGNDELSNQERVEILELLVDFSESYNSNQYLFASDLCNTDDLVRIAGDVITDILVIKPISQSRAEHYLTSLNVAFANDLKGALADKKLFDLASWPWLLARMLDQARRGKLPDSRAAVLMRVVNDSIARIKADRGMQARAADSLYALAWNMHSRRKPSLPLTEAFPIFESARAQRGFEVEDFFEELLAQNLLARVGQEQVRFGYSAVQDYCCARALARMPELQRDAALDDITARLGRLTLLRWWDQSLIILSGLLPPPGVSRLLELVLYGSGFGEGERVYLAARCIQECGPAKVKPELMGQVVDGLIWRSKAANEPHSALRVRAIEALAGLQSAEAIPHLKALAVDKVRRNFIGEDDYEYPAVRLAATLALMRMDEPARVYLWKEAPAVARTFELWHAGNVEELGRVLLPAAASAAQPAGAPPVTSAPELSAAVAAFALGQIGTAKAAEFLIAGFQNLDLPVDTRWSITDTLKLIDPAEVNKKVLLPFFDESGEGSLPPDVFKKRQYRYDQLAYLAGQIKSREDKVLQFLDNCLFKWARVSLKGRAIRAIAAVYTRADGDRFTHYKQCFEQIAGSDFSSIALSQPVAPEDALYLQISALEALSVMGDNASIEYLRARRSDWPAEAEKQFFVTSEEIYWRNATNAMPESDAGA